VPDVESTRDLVAELDSGKFRPSKRTGPVVNLLHRGASLRSVVLVNEESRILATCIRSTVAIVRYGEEFADEGLWEGSLYLFDGRMNFQFSDRAVTIGRCERCDAPTSTFYNCANLACRKLILLCPSCQADTSVPTAHRLTKIFDP